MISMMILLCSSVSAQDFKQLLGAVDKLEASLKEMVSTESGEREEAINQLRTEIANLRTQVNKLQNRPAGSADVSGFEADLNSLASTNLRFRAQLNEHALLIQKFGNNNSSGSHNSCDAEIAELSNQVADLRSGLNLVLSQRSSDIATPGPIGINRPDRHMESSSSLSVGGGGSGLTDARSRLEEKGVSFEMIYTGEVISNTSGGLAQKTEYLENGDIALSIDAEKLMGWSGASFSFYTLGDRGGSISEKVGDAQGVSNIESDDTWKLYEAWYQQNLWGDRLSFLVGLYDLNSEFDAIEYAGLFLNSSFGIGPDYSQSGQNGPSIFPTTSLSFRTRFQPSDAFYFQAAVLDGVPGDPDDPSGTHIKFGPDDGVLVATEVAFLTGTGEGSTARYGKFALGTWHYTAKFDDIMDLDASGDPMRRSGNRGVYLLAEQTVLRDSSDPSQGLGLFARIGFANGNINQFSNYFGAGVVTTGLIPGRDEDRIGFAVASAFNSRKFKQAQQDAGDPVESSETILELSFSSQVLPQLTMRPDLQYVINPGTDPDVDNALVMGFRFELAF